jgi:hypothetical protein
MAFLGHHVSYGFQQVIMFRSVVHHYAYGCFMMTVIDDRWNTLICEKILYNLNQ